MQVKVYKGRVEEETTEKEQSEREQPSLMCHARELVFGSMPK